MVNFAVISMDRKLTHCKEELAIFPSPAGMSLTKLSLGGKKTKLFPPRKSLISDIPAGDGKTAKSFLQCMVNFGMINMAGKLTWSTFGYTLLIFPENLQGTWPSLGLLKLT